ncbi:unnamed protein product [Thlaspi arvense]|uniref:Zinc finger GRF-type domain-containing protein n=1 Tax=Thlaspi arvense TaxID=13288 RepID=A0AAU9RNA8_THLAR|nr:unnamed protein product [Thlaspi arvense]
MAGFVADGQYGIPRRCPYGGSIKHNVSPSPKFKHDFDTQPGSRYFTCTKFKDDGLHFRQPWIFGVKQEIEKLVLKLEEQIKMIEEKRKQIQIQAEEIAKLKT